MLNLQPLRITSGWTIEWNTFMEVDPSPNDMSSFSGSSLLYASNEHLRRAINLEWRPEEDFEGQFILRVIDLIEEFNKITQQVDLSGAWEHPHIEFKSKSRLEIVEKVEQLILQLKPYQDPRIQKKPGVVDETVDDLRVQLKENGASDLLLKEIIKSENRIIQDLLIDNDSVRKADLEQLIEFGVSKGIKKKAAQKLNSKAFKNKL